MSQYDVNSIETLNFREAIRTRVAMYMGSADNQGVLQCIREIISNSIDEFAMGFGSKIEIEFFANNKIQIKDWGRGCPFGKREDGTEALEAIFMTAHSGGKFSEKTYQSVIGMNGIGGKGVALSSLKFEVESRREGKKAILRLEEGLKKSFEIQKTAEGNGTTIIFIPDPKVYNLEEIIINFNDIKDMCRDWAFLNKGLTFQLTNHETKEKIEYISKNGLLDLLKENVSNPINQNPIYYELKEGNIFCEIALQWTKGRENSFTFTNGLHNVEGGTSLTGLKTAITRKLNQMMKTTFSGETARTGLVYAISCKVPNPSFANQTKTKINNPELRKIADRAFVEALDSFCKVHPDDFKKVEDFLKRQEKAEMAAEKAKQEVLLHTVEIEKEVSKKAVLAGKLVDCIKHDENSELWLVEGNSAKGSIVSARDGDKIAVYPMRGKGKNALKEEDFNKVLANEEYKEIMVSLGCGYGAKFNEKKLRYGKIVIASDKDPDGDAIACLILAFFYRVYPELLKQAKIYRAHFPLYVIVAKGDKRYYAYSKEELDAMLKTMPKNVKVLYKKGLGENEPRDFAETIFSKNGVYTQFTYEDGAQADYLFNTLLGDDLAERKKYIFANTNWEEEIIE